MKKNSPEIILLRRKIEESIGRRLHTPADFDFLASVVWERTHETISPTTLKRLWGYIDGADSTRMSTLHLLSRCVGFDSWDDYRKHVEQRHECESDEIVAEYIKSEELAEGDCIEVAWLPNRHCTFRYEGDNRWVVVAAENSKLHVGDTFCCGLFIKGEPLYIDSLIQGDNAPVTFVLGNKSGLTLLHKC